jgi:DNA-binding XRE family transcriptional regulator
LIVYCIDPSLHATDDNSSADSPTLCVTIEEAACSFLTGIVSSCATGLWTITKVPQRNHRRCASALKDKLASFVNASRSTYVEVAADCIGRRSPSLSNVMTRANSFRHSSKISIFHPEVERGLRMDIRGGFLHRMSTFDPIERQSPTWYRRPATMRISTAQRIPRYIWKWRSTSTDGRPGWCFVVVFWRRSCGSIVITRTEVPALDLRVCRTAASVEYVHCESLL